jgi:uncharacterized protein YidB (DUF937 family)
MAFLDQVLAQMGGPAAGALAKAAMSNPKLLQAGLSMLSNPQGSIGGPGGLASVIGALTQGGLGNAVNSWVGGGPNLPVDAGSLASALGPDILGQVAQQAGLSSQDAAGGLASLLPELVNHLTPNGQVPDAGSLQGTIGSLLGALGK